MDTLLNDISELSIADNESSKSIADEVDRLASSLKKTTISKESEDIKKVSKEAKEFYNLLSKSDKTKYIYRYKEKNSSNRLCNGKEMSKFR